MSDEKIIDVFDVVAPASVGWAKARSTVPTKAFREALMSRYRPLKIEGRAFL
jgi:hypothetical protein